MTNESPRHLVKLGVGGFVVGLVIALSATALAHDTATYYPTKWSSDMTWKIGNTYGDTGSFAAWSSMDASVDVWSAVSGSWFDFVDGGRDNSVGYPAGGVCNTPSPHVWVITYNTSPYGAVGRTVLCGGSNLTDVIVEVDDDANWYIGTGTPGASEYDLRSVVAHEMGHATGFAGHFAIVDAACTIPPIHTMCSGISPGTTYKRTLEYHEKDLVANAY